MLPKDSAFPGFDRTSDDDGEQKGQKQKKRRAGFGAIDLSVDDQGAEPLHCCSKPAAEIVLVMHCSSALAAPASSSSRMQSTLALGKIRTVRVVWH